MTLPNSEHVQNGDEELAQFQQPLTDISDKATASEMLEMHYARKAAARAARRDQEPNKDGTYAILDCIECGCEIGLARLAVAIKNTLCIHCAVAQEAKRRT